jgi:hypothetical protein
VGPTARYGNIFRLSYVDDVRTSQETRLWPLRPGTGIALPFDFHGLFNDIPKARNGRMIRAR